MRRAGFAAALILALVAPPPAAADTLYSHDVQTTCDGNKCTLATTFAGADVIERLSCMIDLRAPRGEPPKLVRAVLIGERSSGQGEFGRTELPFEKSFDGGARQIYAVATNPLFGLGPSRRGLHVDVFASSNTTSIKVECYLAGFGRDL